MPTPPPPPSPYPVDVLDNWVDYSTLVIAALSLIATGVGAFLIWRQIRQTGQALRLADDEQKTNRQLLLDSRRARIDDEMPKLLIWVIRQSVTVADPTAPRPQGVYDRVTNRSHRPPDPLLSRVFSTRNPEDMATVLEVTLRVAISNDGPRRALVTLWQHWNPTNPSEVMDLEVGEVADVLIRRRQTVAQWIDYSTGYTLPREDGEDAGTYSEVTVLETYYAFPGKVGAIERWKVIQGGGIFDPVDSDRENWRLRDTIPFTPPAVGGLNATVPFPEREYFADMQERRPL